MQRYRVVRTNVGLARILRLGLPRKASRRREPTRLRPPIKSADAGDLKLGATYRKGTRNTFNVQN